MTDVLKLGKRAFTVAVALATILWSVGISALVLPLQASAAMAGDVIRGETLSTVYYYASDGSRYAFTSEASYFTWYEDFDDVEWMSDDEIADISLAGNIVNRPGSFWIKIQSDPKTYAVTPQGQIRWIESEEVAEDLAGSDWNQFILDVSDSFFPDYTVGTSLMEAGDAYNGALVDMDGTTYLVWNDEMRVVSDDGFDDNMFQDRFVLDGDGMDLAGLDAGDDVDSAESGLTDAAQLGEDVTGGLSVSLASDTASSATIPAGAASVAFTKIKLAATSGSADVDQMVFKLGGVGAVANIDEAYLYNGDGMRLTDGRDVNTSSREVTFSALGIELEEGESTYIEVRADIAVEDTVTGGDSANFYLAGEDSVSGSATVSGSFPISGNTMTFSETPAGTLIVDEVGTISDPTIGEEEAVIAKFSVEADDEDASVEQITLNVDDAGDHSDYQLWNGDDLLASGESDGDELVTFTLTNPLELDEGDTETLEVSATIGGESDDTISVGVEETADVVAIGGDFGFNMAVDIAGYDDTGAACAGDADDCSFSTIIGGELTFAFNGPTSGDIQIDGDDQVLLEFTITAENWTEIQELEVDLECVIDADSPCDEDDDDDDDLKNDAEGEPNLEDITLRESNGSTWMGPEEIGAADADSDTAQAVVFEDTQILQAGESIDLMVTSDINTAAVEGNIFTASLDMSETDAEDANGDALDPAEDIVPSADIVGNEQTLTDSSLDVSVSSSPSGGALVKGATDVDMVGFNFEAGEASDVTVTELTFLADGDTDGEMDVDNADDITGGVNDYISSCSLYDSESGSLVDGPESLDADDELTFDNFDWTVEAGETERLIVNCDFSNVDVDDDDDDAYILYIDDADNVVAEDDDGDDIDATLVDDNEDAEVVVVVTDAGDLTITLSGSSPNATIILGDDTDVEVGVWKFDADDEPFTVKTLTFENGGDDNVADSVVVSCEDVDGEEVTKTGFLSGGEVTFENLTCYVGTSSTESITVTVNTGTVSSTGADSGDTFDLTLDLTDAGSFEAVGASSGETIDEGDVGADVPADEFVLRKSKPTLSLASGSPSGAGVPGLSEVLRFNLAADSRGFVQLNEILFKVTSTDGGASDWNTCGELDDVDLWDIYDSDDSSTKLDADADDDAWTFLDDAGGDCTAGEDVAFAELDFEDADDGAQEIGAGETVTYVLRVDTTGASSTDDDSIRIDLPDEEEADDQGAFDAISWEDDTEGAGAAADDDDDSGDIDGELIRNLPVTGGTISY